MRVLVIEDEEKMADVLKRGLEEESFEVDVASDGDRGLELAKTSQHDFIILDIGLPRNGRVPGSARSPECRD